MTRRALFGCKIVSPTATPRGALLWSLGMICGLRRNLEVCSAVRRFERRTLPVLCTVLFSVFTEFSPKCFETMLCVPRCQERSSAARPLSSDLMVSVPSQLGFCRTFNNVFRERLLGVQWGLDGGDPICGRRVILHLRMVSLVEHGPLRSCASGS